MEPGNDGRGRDTSWPGRLLPPVSWGTVRAALYSSKIHGVNQNSLYAEEFRWSSRGSGPENLIVGQGLRRAAALQKTISCP
jgi:hypothetical protein